MKKQIVNLLLVAVMVGTIFMGCGSYSSDNTDSPNIVTEAETPDSVEGYFEENNITVEGAGVEKENTLKEFMYLSSVKSTDKDAKVLDAEFTGAIGINEKIEGNTKTITVNIEPIWDMEDLGIGEHYVYYIYGFVDRYTGICYIDDKELTPTTTINTGEKEYTLSFNFNQEDNIITITCPSDYDGAAFFVCGTNEELLKENQKNMDKFVSISDITYGDYDMKFFAK